MISFDSLWVLKGKECTARGAPCPPFLAMDGAQPADYEDYLNRLQSANEVADCLLKTRGAWAVVYHRLDLKKLFVGRDVFGRYSLVWTRYGDTLAIGCSVDKEITSEWQDVPYGQVTAICLETLSAQMFSFFAEYPEEADATWRAAFTSFYSVLNPSGQGLFTLSRSMEPIPHSVDPSDELKRRLEDSCRRMVPEGTTEVAVAFSGGVDSLLVAHTLLAAADSAIPTIFLVNVAFGADEDAWKQAPDRIRALAAWPLLRSLDHSNRLRLILCNVCPEELDNCRTEHIAQAAAPALSVLDDSLACVLWFTMRAKGVDYCTSEEITCTAELFFVGSGADELFAGYARHRTRCERDGMENVAEECEKELCRLGNRNGGRDGRVAKQLKRKLAAPFLDDDVVKWANQLPIRWKCDLTLPRGEGEKQIIRKCLRQMGAPHNAPKQAMQFGSRMAKMSNSSKTVKGSDVSAHLAKARAD